MPDPAEVRAPLGVDEQLPVAAAIAIGPGAITTHCGLYVRGESSTMLVHLAWHRRLRCDTPASSLAQQMGWVEPQVPREKLDVLAELALLAVERAVARKPLYGFRFVTSAVGDDGALVVGEDELGFTCATFVLALCERAQVELLDRPTWTQAGCVRRLRDSNAQRRLVKLLRESPHVDDREHAPRLESEIGAVRFRTEEIAAASAVRHRPLDFTRASRAGFALLASARATTWWGGR